MRKLLLPVTVIAVGFSLTACAASQPRWYKSGVNKQDTYSYYQECEYNIGMNKVSPEKERRLMRACMEKAGFRLIR